MIFKDGKRSFYVISKKEASRDKALKIANSHFKTKADGLEIAEGKMLDEETVQIGVKGDLWVVSRKGKA